MLISKKWLEDYFDAPLPKPEQMEKLLSLHAFEIEGIQNVDDDHILDVDVLPNRSSDCLCHRGIAHELAAILGQKLDVDPLREKVKLKETDSVRITLSDAHGCRKFGAALMGGIAVTESPDWLKKRLSAIGQRPINNVVDATNYVMFSLGQPLHAYDADKLAKESGAYSLGVRFAREGEQITVLTGETYALSSDIQLIIDGKDTPVGIAGIKGGAHAEIDKGTTRIVIEAANFDPTVTRKASQKLRLQTDASKRFENEPARELIEYALRETTVLLSDIAGGNTEGYVVQDTAPPSHEPVSVSHERANALLGLSFETNDIESIFDRLQFTYESTDNGWTVHAPLERTDINIEEDIVEEIGRLHGYEHIPSVVPEPVVLREVNARQYYSEKVRNILAELGFSEVITSSFRKKDDVKLQNALASDKQYLRSSLRKNIAEALEQNIHNVDLLGLPDVRIFEIGTVFSKAASGVKEHVSLCLGVTGKRKGFWKESKIPKDALETLAEELNVSELADVAIDEGVAEINFSKLLEKLPAPDAYEPHEVSEEIQYRPFSQYPFISRDIALWVPEGISADEVEKLINREAGELCVRTTLFDEFEKDGRVSYAFRMVFQSQERTLTDGEIEPIMAAVNSAVEAQKWEVR